jgi:hypothetical protein
LIKSETWLCVNKRTPRKQRRLQNIQKIQDVAKKIGLVFVPIKLFLDIGEHKKRVENPQRRKFYKKQTCQQNLQKGVIKTKNTNTLEIDITNLSPTGVARVIEK